MKLVKFSVLVLTASTMIMGCASSPSNTQKGAGIGAVVGALLGKATGDHDKSRYAWGAAVGAIAGAAIGGYMDKQEEAFREELSDSGVDVVRDGNQIQLILPSDITFDTNSASVSASFDAIVGDVAKILNEYEKTTLIIKGHTDNTGTSEYNQALSERRAESVKSMLVSASVNPMRVTVVGMGEYQPKVANSSPELRTQNRRVELEIIPVT